MASREPAALCAVVEVRRRDAGFEVIAGGHRRGAFFAELPHAVLHGEGLAPEVLVVSRAGKVERTFRSRGVLKALVAEHYAALANVVRKDCDGHWSIGWRFSYGEGIGWFVEHDGYCYDGLDRDGEDGPHPDLASAQRCMADHLRAAIAQARRGE